MWFWRKNKIFEKSLEQTEGKKNLFFEGPPTANGKPGIHHLEARAFKDAIRGTKLCGVFMCAAKVGGTRTDCQMELQVEKSLD